MSEAPTDSTTLPSKWSRYRRRQREQGMCEHCRMPVYLPESTRLCMVHLASYRRQSRRLDRGRTGYQPWKAGRPGRPPKNLMLEDGESLMADLDANIATLLESTEETEEHKIGVLLGCCVVLGGPCNQALAWELAVLTGYGSRLPRHVVQRCWDTGIFEYRTMRADWLDETLPPAQQNVALVLDILLIQGLVERGPTTHTGADTWITTEPQEETNGM